MVFSKVIFDQKAGEINQHADIKILPKNFPGEIILSFMISCNDLSFFSELLYTYSINFGLQCL